MGVQLKGAWFIVRKALVGLVLAAVAAHASPQGVRAGTVRTQQISAATAARYVILFSPYFSTSASGNVAQFVYPHVAGARLVDLVVEQVGAGVGGSSWTADVQIAGGTSMLSTLASIPIGAGAFAAVDALAEIAAASCSSCTRPVIKTDATPVVNKGTHVIVKVVETGSYSTHPTAVVTLKFEPFQ